MTNLKRITLREMREKIDELRTLGLNDLEYKNLRYLAYDFIPNQKCKVCHKNEIRIFEGEGQFITMFDCEDCDIKKGATTGTYNAKTGLFE